MPWKILQPDGTYAPDPEHYPTDLVTVRDTWGRRHRVRKAHLEEARKPIRADGYGRRLLPIFNQYGRRLVDRRPGRALLHRDNLANEH